MMKKLTTILVVVVMMLSAGCSGLIPMQTNLSNQTMLMAENRNVAVEYSVTSDISDGPIDYVLVQKNGVEVDYPNTHEYAIETALNKVWGQYFSAKFNPYAKDTMVVEVNLIHFCLKNRQANSIGAQLLTGNVKLTMEAEITVDLKVTYQGETFGKIVEVTTSGYNESQQKISLLTGYTHTAITKNPTQQKSELIDDALNKTIIQFENFMKSIDFEKE